MKFARQQNGAWFDPVEGVDLASLDTRFAADWVSARKLEGTWFQAVTDQVFYGLFPSPPSHDLTLTWKELADYLVSLLGGGTAGRAALGSIIKSCQGSAQGADNFFAAYFQGQTKFTKAEFMAVLSDVSIAIVTSGQKAAVSNNWPKG